MLELPPELARHTGAIHEAEQPAYGDNFVVWLVAAERGRFVVKIGRRPETIAELETESRLLEQLELYAPFVSQPVARADAGEDGWFLFTYLPGEAMAATAAQATSTRERAALAAEFGRTLRAIHAWKPPLEVDEQWLEHAVARAEENVLAGRIADPCDDPVYRTGTPLVELLSELRAGLPGLEADLVFCHGDWCLPNAIVRGGRIIGAVDWSRGGYADRRHDLATGAWTLRYNLRDPGYVTAFLDAYGYRRPQSSLRWFEALHVLSL